MKNVTEENIPMTVKRKVMRSIYLLMLLTLVLPGCIRENPVDPPSHEGPDPLYGDQWHLKNTGQGEGLPGEDINVEPVWESGNRGSSVYIAIVDDGIDTDHEDLYANIVQNLNYNYDTGSTILYPGEHGTSVSGVAAAVDNNSLGGRGAAPDANIFGYNLLYSWDTYTVSNEMNAMVRNKELVFVSNNSWGPVDCTGQLDVSPSLWKAGIDEGVTTGRGGKGIVYTWAAGNGSAGACPDNSNYDGYANYYGVMAVAAVSNHGTQSCYSEPGANIWISAYSSDPSLCSGTGLGITTTDIMGSAGYDSGNYTSGFGGTSSAAPLAAGSIALVFNANPNLTWRDLRIILARTARQIDLSGGGWDTNGAPVNSGNGYNISYKYGFGVIDTSAAVTMAKTWSNVGSMDTIQESNTTPMSINGGSSSIITVSGSDINAIEYVEISVTIYHTNTGDLRITLTPQTTTTESILAEPHNCYDSYGDQTTCTFFSDNGPSGNTFTFGSARHLGETANQVWQLSVTNGSGGTSGTLIDWSLKFYGRK